MPRVSEKFTWQQGDVQVLEQDPKDLSLDLKYRPLPVPSAVFPAIKLAVTSEGLTVFRFGPGAADSVKVAATSEGLCVWKFNPSHDKAGRFASGRSGLVASQAAGQKGGYAANGMTVTSVGMLGEKVAQRLGMQPFSRGEHTYTRPCDFRIDGKFAVEVKTFSATNRDPKVRMVPAALKRKVAFAKAHKLKPMTVAVHLSSDLKSGVVYRREGFGNYRIGAMERVGRVRL